MLLVVQLSLLDLVEEVVVAVAMTTIKIQKEQRQVLAVAVEQEFPLVLVVAVDLVEFKEVLVPLELLTLLVKVVAVLTMMEKHMVVQVERVQPHLAEKEVLMEQR